MDAKGDGIGERPLPFRHTLWGRDSVKDMEANATHLLRVINVLDGKVHSETLGRDLVLLSGKSKGLW